MEELGRKTVGPKTEVAGDIPVFFVRAHTPQYEKKAVIGRLVRELAEQLLKERKTGAKWPCDLR